MTTMGTEDRKQILASYDSDSESDASGLSDDEVERLEREIRRSKHPVKDSIVSFRESSVSTFLKRFFAKADEKDNIDNTNDEGNSLTKTTSSYSVALTKGHQIFQ